MLFLALYTGLFFSWPWPASASKLFPEYPEIREAVKFWEAIYSTHSTTSSVIHDRDQPSRIYEVLQLLDKNLPGAERINRTAVRQTVKKYSNILQTLGKGNAPVTMDEIRVAAMFTASNRLAQMADAANRIRSQTGQKERFRDGVIRSGAYLKAIKEIFRSNGLPTELAYLPHVESSFNTRAYSKFGAAGVWQFTKATGKQYMQINDAVDERRDPIIAAEAAAKYLKNGYMLLGEWPLAITAYNYGTAGMLRAQNSHGNYPAIFAGYRDGHFGFASRNFYPEFLAALKVAKRLEHDSSIPRDKPLPYIAYTLPGFIHIYDVKKHFKIKEKQIRRLNPALKETIFQGKRLIPRRYQLRLPAGTTTQQLIKTVPRKMLANNQIKESFYRVKRGDTAGAIALHNNIPLKVLLQTNALDADARIYVGQRLRVPSHPKRKADEPLLPHLVADQESSKRFSSPQKKKADRIPVIQARQKRYPAQTPLAGETIQQDKITVHPDETLPLLAHWLKIDESRLRRANNLEMTTTLEPGQRLTVLYEKISAAEFADLRADFARENEEDFFTAFQIVEQVRYQVKQGDTIWSLCNQKFHIPLWLLKKYNDSMDYSLIQQSQTLIIPIVRER